MYEYYILYNKPVILCMVVVSRAVDVDACTNTLNNYRIIYIRLRILIATFHFLEIVN